MFRLVLYLGIGALRLSFIIVLFYQKAKHSIKLYGNQRDEELDDEETDVNSVAIWKWGISGFSGYTSLTALLFPWSCFISGSTNWNLCDNFRFCLLTESPSDRTVMVLRGPSKRLYSRRRGRKPERIRWASRYQPGAGQEVHHFRSGCTKKLHGFFDATPLLYTISGP